MKAIIVEDSRLAREGLVRMLSAHTDIEIVGAVDNVNAALALIADTHPDVLFLDIEMPSESGFDLLEKLEYEPYIIFVTGYSEYAVRAFENNAVDYLLKPISDERLDTAINKLRSLELGTHKEVEMELDIKSRIIAKASEKTHLVPLGSIQYFETDKNHVRMFFNGKHALIRRSLNEVEARLPKGYFIRVSRQHIVNMHFIADIEDSIGYGYDLTMSDGKSIEVSRRNAAKFRAVAVI